MSKEYSELDLEKFISFDEETNISKCLVPECHSRFVGKQELAIQRHYCIAHNVDIEDSENNEHMLNIHNTYIHNGVDVGERNPPHFHYSIKYVNDNTKAKIKLNNGSQDTSEDKVYKTFLIDDYVEYFKETNISKCLLKNCERRMSGRRSGNIKRHYDKVHNFIIVHEKIRIMQKELDLYYNNDTFGDGVFYEDNEEEMFDVSDHNSSTTINYDQYIDYDILTNKSLCKFPGCKTYLQGRRNFSIKRHYGMVHNYDIGSNGAKLYNPKHIKHCNGSFQNISTIPGGDLVIYDITSASYQCLFKNCNQILEKELPSLKRHYHEIHKIIIAKRSDNIPLDILHKKRKNRDTNYHFESSFSREDEEFLDESDSCPVKNEALSDDDFPHCSKRPNHTSTYSITKGSISEDMKPKSAKIEIKMTKLTFFKLCLDLVIERDISINLFDDEKLFKKLLVPFEQIFECHVNSSLIQRLMVTANNIVLNGLKEMFTNQIICLELHVVNYEKQFHLIFNVRFLNEKIICNKVIGVLPITKARTGILPIFEHLNKFNIDKQQVYMTTIIGALQDDEEIDEICNELCKHNPMIKRHPIYYIQTILRSFVQKFSQDIKRWQELIKYERKLNMDVFNNLKELDKYIENLSGTDITDLRPQLAKAKPFLKALKILRTFIERLSEEQYVAGDFYRDWLYCEVELKAEITKGDNSYVGKLYEDLTECKNTLLQSSELMAALYLDVRFNFLDSRLISDDGKTKGKLFLCAMWENFYKFIRPANSSVDVLTVNGESNDDSNDDEYALLNQYVNDIMQVKSSVSIQDVIATCVPRRRKPFNLDILSYWHCKRKDMKDINELTKIAFTLSSSQYVLTYLQTNFSVSYKDNDKFDKFLIKNNQNMLEKNIDLLFEDF